MRNSVALAMLALFGAVHGYPKGYKNCTESIVTVTKTGEPPSDSCGQGYGPGVSVFLCTESCRLPCLTRDSATIPAKRHLRLTQRPDVHSQPRQEPTCLLRAQELSASII